MDKTKMQTFVGIFLVVWIVFFIANYMILKRTVKWSEEDLVDTTALEEDDLRLTWDISGEMTPPDEKLKQIEERHKQQQKELRALVDSVVTGETVPLKEEVDKTQKELKMAKDDMAEMEELLATLTTKADSIDLVKAKRLSKILEGMKPSMAASILTRLNSNVNAELLMKMRQKQAAKILAELPQNRAAEIAKFLSEAYARNTI